MAFALNRLTRWSEPHFEKIGAGRYLVRTASGMRKFARDEEGWEREAIFFVRPDSCVSCHLTTFLSSVPSVRGTVTSGNPLLTRFLASRLEERESRSMTAKEEFSDRRVLSGVRLIAVGSTSPSFSFVRSTDERPPRPVSRVPTSVELPKTSSTFFLLYILERTRDKRKESSFHPKSSRRLE